jgi:hypothetical protein
MLIRKMLSELFHRQKFYDFIKKIFSSYRRFQHTLDHLILVFNDLISIFSSLPHELCDIFNKNIFTFFKILNKDSITIEKIKKNGSFFSSLNSTDLQMFNSSSMSKLSEIFQLFKGISPGSSVKGFFFYIKII